MITVKLYPAWLLTGNNDSQDKVLGAYLICANTAQAICHQCRGWNAIDKSQPGGPYIVEMDDISPDIEELLRAAYTFIAVIRP